MANPPPMKTILIVDDDRDILEVLSSAFNAAEIKVITAEGGGRAVSMAETDRFDAIITDFKMPQMNGLELTRCIRSGRINRNTPIFMVTGNADAEALRKVAALGVASIILKPLSPIDVANKVLEKILPKPKAPVTYDAIFINCCIQSARDVLEFYLGTAPILEKPMIKTDAVSHGFASGLIAICHKSEILGSLSLTVDKGFIIKLAKSIFGESGPPIDDAMIGDMTGEMSNQLVGKLKIYLGKEGYYISIGLPEVIVGENHMIAHKANNPVLCISIKCAGNRATIEICLSGAIEKGAPPEVGRAPLR